MNRLPIALIMAALATPDMVINHIVKLIPAVPTIPATIVDKKRSFLLSP